MTQATEGAIQQLLYAAFLATSDAVVLCAPDGSIFFWNDAAADMFGIGEAEAKGQSFPRILDDCRFVRDQLGPGVGSSIVPPCGGASCGIRNERVIVRSATEPEKESFALLTVTEVRDASANLVGLLSILKDNTEAEMQTRTDALTSVSNRGEFEARLAREYARLEGMQFECLSLLFIDCDDFGEINKRFGHQIGDQVLRGVGAALRATRALDVAARLADPGRYGGEEFCLVLPNTDASGAKHVAERLAERFRTIAVPVASNDSPPKVVRVTASIGIATHRVVDNLSVTDLVRQANDAMLTAKRAGKNRAVAFSDMKVA